MTQYIAKPNINTDTGMKTFNVESDAIKYLEEYTGYEMSYERNRKYFNRPRMGGFTRWVIKKKL